MNLNKAMLIGRLGRDPEKRNTKSGDDVANFSIATTESWKNAAGVKQEKTEWHNIVCWGQLAGFAQNYLRKGALVYVEGSLQTQDWTDDQNVKHYKTEIKAHTIRFMEPKGSDAPGNDETRPAPATEEAYITDDIPF